MDHPGRTTPRLAARAAQDALAMLCMVVSLWIVFVARIGPVVATLSRTHGIHTGDLGGVVMILLAGLLVIGGRLHHGMAVPAMLRVPRSSS